MELWRKNLYGLWFAQLIAMIGLSLIIPFLPLYLRELGVTGKEALKIWRHPYISFVSIALSFGIAFLTARTLTKPLKALTQGVQHIERGDLNQQVIVTTADEFGMLADSFNRMAKALAEGDVTITVTTNSPPVAHAGPDQDVEIGATVLLSGANSSDVDGDALTYSASNLPKNASFDPTTQIFTNPKEQVTEEYITGRFG